MTISKHFLTIFVVTFGLMPFYSNSQNSQDINSATKQNLIDRLSPTQKKSCLNAISKLPTECKPYAPFLADWGYKPSTQDADQLRSCQLKAAQYASLSPLADPGCSYYIQQSQTGQQSPK